MEDKKEPCLQLAGSDHKDERGPYLNITSSEYLEPSCLIFVSSGCKEFLRITKEGKIIFSDFAKDKNPEELAKEFIKILETIKFKR